MKPLHLVFAGTPELAAVILNGLFEDKTHQIKSVITQPDRRAGRGRGLAESPVKKLAREYEIEISQPERAEALDPDDKLGDVDLMVVAAFGMILPKEILERPRLGSINVHTSLLPRWRGAAPIQRAIQSGDLKTGITIMQMDEGLDTGDILMQRECLIDEIETAGTLHDKLATLGSECLLEVLQDLTADIIRPRKQEDSLATYAKKITKEEALIDWNMKAVDIERMVRAFNPVPVAHTVLNGQAMRIWQTGIVNMDQDVGPPGTIISADTAGILVATAKDALLISLLQLPGKKIITAGDFLNGHPGFAR